MKRTNSPVVLKEYLRKKLDTLGREKLIPEQRLLRRSRADYSDLDFATIYFPAIFNEPWNNLHLHIAHLQSGKYTISGARKFGKSAFVMVAKVIKSLCLLNEGIINISLRTQTNAKERTASIVRLIKRNKLLCYDYNIKVTQNLKGYYIINGVHLVATSVQTGLRSIINDNFKRFNLSVNDDLYNINTVFSDNDNKKVYDFITSEVYGQMEDDGLSITLGNSINAKCPIRMLAEEYPENHFSLPATNETGKTNWAGHSLYTDSFWKQKQTEIPHSVWMGEYMDKPVEKGEYFDTAWIKFIDISKLNFKAIITVIDPGYGSSPSACKKGIATLGITHDNKFVCLDIYLRNEDYSLVFSYIKALQKRLPQWKNLYFENDFNQWFIAKPYYDDWCKTNSNSIPIILFTAREMKTEFFSSDKESRIMNLIHPHQTGNFYYCESMKGSADYKEYISQYTGFGKKGSLVDGLDAMASAYIHIQKFLNSNQIETFNQKEFNRDNMSWLNRF